MKPGLTVHADGSQTYYDAELSDEIGNAVDRVLKRPFRGVQPGGAGFFWFEEDRADGVVEHVVRRVMRGAGGDLWLGESGHEVRMTRRMAARYEGCVAPLAKPIMPSDEELMADARETARFAVYDALCVVTGEAGLRVAPDQMNAWANQILESLLRADVGWAIGVLADADAALRVCNQQQAVDGTGG